MEDTRGIVRLGMSYDLMPVPKDLQRFLTDYCMHWRDIGILLGLKSSVLDLVASAHPMQDRECFRVTLEKWLQLNDGVTWGNLELAITNANCESLGLQPLKSIPIAQSDFEDGQDGKSSAMENTNDGTTDHMVGCIGVKRQFRHFVIMNLRKSYSKVIRELIHIFKEKKVDVEELITILRFDDVEKKSIFSTDHVFNIIKTEIQLFQHVGQYCKGIYDYQILDVLVQASGCSEAMKELNDFTELRQNSILAEINLLSEHGELLHPDDFMPGTYKFIIEYVGGKCTIETKEMVQGIVEQCVRLEKGTLIFKGVEPGSILFVYQISEAVKNYLLGYKFTEEEVAFLVGNNITNLIVDSVKIMSSFLPNKELQHDVQAIQLESMISNHLDKFVTSLSPHDQEATLLALKRIFDNVIQYPHDDKHRQIKLTDETFSSKVWQYPAGKELMKMGGWVVEGDHVRLRNDSCVKIVSQLLMPLVTSLATDVVPFPDDEFQAVVKAIHSGDIPCIKNLLKLFNVSRNGRMYSETGYSLNLLSTATIAQTSDIVELLLKEYYIDPYYMNVDDNTPVSYIEDIFWYAPESFIISIMKYCGVKRDFKTAEGFSLLHYAVFANCFHIVYFLLDYIDVNVTTTDYLQTPLHLAYLYGHTQIAKYLIQCGADEYAVNSDGCIPYEYFVNSDPDCIQYSEYIQNKRKIHHVPYSREHCYYMKLLDTGIDDEEAVFLTMEQLPSLKRDSPT